MDETTTTRQDSGRRPGILSHLHFPVFIPAAALILAFVITTVIVPGTVQDVVSAIEQQVVGIFGWYYIALVSAFVLFAVVVGLSRFGDVKLGPDAERPEFGLFSWLAMLFAAGMGIGLVFFGVAEPLSHYADPKPGTGGGPGDRAESGLVQTLLHWGLHPWAIYVIVGLSIAYAVHRKGRSMSIRWALEPLLGNRVRGVLGDVIDVAAIVGTLFGVATSLGLGVLQITAGLNFLELVEAADESVLIPVVLIALITGIATISVVTGLARGIRWLSNFNVSVAGLLALFVLITGPTLFIMREFVQTIGLYLQNVLQLSFDVAALARAEGTEWQGLWTTFYWGWWISWAPFVGVFIARISRGRTVREFVGGVLLVPTLVTFAWFAIFGGASLFRELFGQGGLVVDGAVDTEGALFGLLEGLPYGTVAAIVAIVLIAMFFVTSSDSGSLVIDMLATGGSQNPPTGSRVFWAVGEGAVAAALLIAGGGGETALTALRTVAVLSALPFSIVMIAMCFATWRQLRAEREAMTRIEQRRHTDQLTQHVSQALGSNNDENPRAGPGGTGSSARQAPRGQSREAPAPDGPLGSPVSSGDAPTGECSGDGSSGDR